MTSDRYSHRGFLGWLDRLLWWHLLVALLVITFGGAVAYILANKVDSASDILPTYLKDGESDDTSPFWKALYFSVVTEATLGYGDYRPTGANRLIASAQVLAGYALFGIVLAKITSISGAESRRLQYYASGVWYNYTIHKDNRITVDICQIFPSSSNGNLRMCGANYSEEGQLLGPYQSDLISANWPTLMFIYQNAPNDRLPWSEGLMTIQFVENGDEPANAFAGMAKDFADGSVTSFPGWRLDGALMAKYEAKQFTTLIADLVARHRPS